MSAFKQFAIYETARLQFRADFFNVFNQVNFGTRTVPVLISENAVGDIPDLNRDIRRDLTLQNQLIMARQ